METLLVASIVAGAVLFMGAKVARTVAAARARRRDGACGGDCCGS